jgi:hypothetical protein
VRSLKRALRRRSGLQRWVFARLNCGSSISRCRRRPAHALLLGKQSLRLSASRRCFCAALKPCAMVGVELLLCEHTLQRPRGGRPLSGDDSGIAAERGSHQRRQLCDDTYRGQKTGLLVGVSIRIGRDVRIPDRSRCIAPKVIRSPASARNVSVNEESLDVHFVAFIAGNRARVLPQLRGSGRCQAVACAPTWASNVVRIRPAAPTL